MAFMVGVIKKPSERLEIEIALLKGESKSQIISIQEKNISIENTLVVRIMIAVVAEDQNQVFKGIIPESKIPIEFRPFASIVVGHKLSEKRDVFSKENGSVKSIVPPIFRTCEIIVAGKGSGKLKLPKKLSMKE